MMLQREEGYVNARRLLLRDFRNFGHTSEITRGYQS